MTNQETHPTTSFLTEVQERFDARDERGNFVMSRVYKLGAVAAAATLVAAPIVAGFLGSGDILGSEYSASNRVDVETLDIRPVKFDCRALNTYAVDGELATKWTVFGKGIPGTGFRIVFDEMDLPEDSPTDRRSKATMLTCATDVSTEITTEGEKEVVKVDLTSLVFDTRFKEEDTTTRAAKADKLFTTSLATFSSVLNTPGQIGCAAGNLFGNDADCEDFDLGKWETESEAALTRQLRVETLKIIQEDCAPQEWQATKEAMTKSYQQQAIDQGFSPDSVTVVYTNDKWEEVDEDFVPDFSTGAMDELEEQGVTLKSPPKTGIEIIPNVSCTQLDKEAA